MVFILYKKLCSKPNQVTFVMQLEARQVGKMVSFDSLYSVYTFPMENRKMYIVTVSA